VPDASTFGSCLLCLLCSDLLDRSRSRQQLAHEFGCVTQVVQGYKFNIFYPDLIDKLEAPTYSLEKDPGADEHGSTCMLRCVVHSMHSHPHFDSVSVDMLVFRAVSFGSCECHC